MNISAIFKSVLGAVLFLVFLFVILWVGAWSFYLVFNLIDWVAEIGIIPMPPSRTEF
jgi:hypothetical protein